MSRLSSEDRDSELIKSGESFIRDDKSTSLTPSLTNSLAPAPSIHRSLPPSPSLPLPPSLCLSLSRRRCSSSRGPPPRRDFSNTPSPFPQQHQPPPTNGCGGGSEPVPCLARCASAPIYGSRCLVDSLCLDSSGPFPQAVSQTNQRHGRYAVHGGGLGGAGDSDGGGSDSSRGLLQAVGPLGLPEDPRPAFFPPSCRHGAKRFNARQTASISMASSVPYL